MKISLFALWGISFLIAVKSETNDYARAAIGVAMYESDMGRYPRKRSVYNSNGGTTYAGTSVEMISMSLTGSPSPDPGQADLPRSGGKFNVDSFFDVFTELSVDSGNQEIAISLLVTNTGSGHVPDVGPPADTFNGSWETDITSMSLTRDTPIGLITIRESPTKPSTGQHTITDFGDGTGLMDSFFDVWTEVRIGDASQPFLPALSSINLELTQIIPEPSAGMLAFVGLLLIGYCRMRVCRLEQPGK